MFNFGSITLLKWGRLHLWVCDSQADLTLLWRGFWLCLGVREAAWGFTEHWYDGPISTFQAGRLFRFGWMYSFGAALRW